MATVRWAPSTKAALVVSSHDYRSIQMVTVRWAPSTKAALVVSSVPKQLAASSGKISRTSTSMLKVALRLSYSTYHTLFLKSSSLTIKTNVSVGQLVQ